MIVCVCHGVNDRALNTVIDSGAQSLREVGDACGAGTDCGQCCRDIVKKLRDRAASVSDRPERAPLSK
ncbi:MAG: (2Fe-2S)-binding protein [Alphaproteobacteria bacterium]|nr:(2Fe-2S)-binding protein [Alphaproteobacteria bacterium]